MAENTACLEMLLKYISTVLGVSEEELVIFWRGNSVLETHTRFGVTGEEATSITPILRSPYEI